MPYDTIFVEGELERDSQIYPSTCSLDFLPTKEVIGRIVVDYVYYRISLKRYNGIQLFVNERGKSVDHRVSDLILRQLEVRAEEFERKFEPRFENRNAMLLTTPERAQVDFQESLNSIWADGLANWGRLLGCITFTATYCVNCINTGMVFIIKTLVEQAVITLDAKMGKWILAHGGWRGMLTALEDMKLN